MHGMKLLMYLAVIFFFLISSVKGKNGCRDLEYLKCIENKTLTGHVISAFRMLVPALQSCQSKCFNQPKCVSYNLGPVDRHARSCELSTADHSTRPSFLVNKNGHKYCPIRNPCLSHPCPVGRLCTPDFAWNTFNCDDGGWTQWGPWSEKHCPKRIPLETCVPTRKRNCSNPLPQNNGNNCSGHATEKRRCDLPTVNTTGCKHPLGMEDGRIPDHRISASSYFHGTDGHAPRHGRLNRKTQQVWAAGGNRIDEYIQIDLGSTKNVTMVATQGRYAGDNDQWVTKYKLTFSNDNKTWNDCFKVFNGNKDIVNIVQHELEVPIAARYVRLIVKGYFVWPCMKLELYGC